MFLSSFSGASSETARLTIFPEDRLGAPRGDAAKGEAEENDEFRRCDTSKRGADREGGGGELHCNFVLRSPCGGGLE